MKIILTISFVTVLFFTTPAFSQVDSSLLKSSNLKDTSNHTLAMDAMYNRPFLKAGKLPVSIGGYVESDWQYFIGKPVSIPAVQSFRGFNHFKAY
jgi:hypothetical protein